jgi:hypothetical protein
MQHDVINNTKVLKTQRDSKSEQRKLNSNSVLKSSTGQTGVPCPRESSVHRTCLIFLPASGAIYQTCPVLDQTSLTNNMTVGI